MQTYSLFRTKPSLRSGFTLIELLVVISIIGLLSSIVLGSVNVARIKARDTKRISDLRQIRIALELYYSDHGQYPPSPCGVNCNGYYLSYNSSWDTFAAALAPYISLPKDPRNTACSPWNANCYSYAYGNVGTNSSGGYQTGYDLVTQFEDQSSPYRCGLKNYRLNIAGQAWCQAFGGSYSNYMYKAV